MADLDKVLVLDFGSQYTQLIARKIRELGVYCEIVLNDVSAEQIRDTNAKAIVLSGGPASVFEANCPRMDEAILDLGLPTLGICYGMQLLAQMLGGEVERRGGGEY